MLIFKTLVGINFKKIHIRIYKEIFGFSRKVNLDLVDGKYVLRKRYV